MPLSPHRSPGPAPVQSSLPEAELSLSAALRAVYQQAGHLLHDHLRLAALEAQRAVRNLALMIALGVVVALLGVTAWLALVAGTVALAVDLGASWAVAFLVASITSIAAALAAVIWIRRLAAQLAFALTLDWLRPAAPRAAPRPREAAI